MSFGRSAETLFRYTEKTRKKNPLKQPNWRTFMAINVGTQNWTISENYFFVMMEKWENVGF